MAQEYFTGTDPVVPVYKGGVVRYAHNKKELDKLTKSENEGGWGGSTKYQPQDWPKVMSHPTGPEIKVNTEPECRAAMLRGYNFDQWDNAQAKLGSSGEAPGSFDPKAQAKMAELERENKKMREDMAEIKDMLKDSLKKREKSEK